MDFLLFEPVTQLSNVSLTLSISKKNNKINYDRMLELLDAVDTCIYYVIILDKYSLFFFLTLYLHVFLLYNTRMSVVIGRVFNVFIIRSCMYPCVNAPWPRMDGWKTHFLNTRQISSIIRLS